MRISKQQLKKIINEEHNKLLLEQRRGPAGPERTEVGYTGRYAPEEEAQWMIDQVDDRYHKKWREENPEEAAAEDDQQLLNDYFASRLFVGPPDPRLIGHGVHDPIDGYIPDAIYDPDFGYARDPPDPLKKEPGWLKDHYSPRTVQYRADLRDAGRRLRRRWRAAAGHGDYWNLPDDEFYDVGAYRSGRRRTPDPLVSTVWTDPGRPTERYYPWLRAVIRARTKELKRRKQEQRATEAPWQNIPVGVFQESLTQPIKKIIKEEFNKLQRIIKL